MPLPLWRLTGWRRRAFEFFGSDRYSRPACFDLERRLDTLFERPGYFVEVGAVDGFFESNTYFLERFRGWSGLLIEPSPTMFARIARNRPNAAAVNCALVSFDYGSPTVTLTDAHAFSGIFTADTAESEARLTAARQFGDPRAVDVPARTLQSILDELGVRCVDFFSLDVEGYEDQVLRGLDFTRVRPRYILAECITPQQKETLDARLSPWYDRLGPLSTRDVFYRSKDA
jgi:FkbM family methyltransferase